MTGNILYLQVFRRLWEIFSNDCLHNRVECGGWVERGGISEYRVLKELAAISRRMSASCSRTVAVQQSCRSHVELPNSDNGKVLEMAIWYEVVSTFGTAILCQREMERSYVPFLWVPVHSRPRWRRFGAQEQTLALACLTAEIGIKNGIHLLRKRLYREQCGEQVIDEDARRR